MAEPGETRTPSNPRPPHGPTAGDQRLREPAAAGEEAGANREGVRRLGRAAVHRALDPADDPASCVRDQEAGGGAKIDGDGAHASERIPRLQEKPSFPRKKFVSLRARAW